MKNASAGYWIWSFLTLMLLGTVGGLAFVWTGLTAPEQDNAFEHSQRFIYDLNTKEVEGNARAFLHLADAAPAAEHTAEHTDTPSAESNHKTADHKTPDHSAPDHKEGTTEATRDTHTSPAHHAGEHDADKHAPPKTHDDTTHAAPAHDDGHTKDTHATDAHAPAAVTHDTPPHEQAPHDDAAAHSNSQHEAPHAPDSHDGHTPPKDAHNGKSTDTAHAAAPAHPPQHAAPAAPKQPAAPPAPPPPPWADYMQSFSNPKGLPTISLIVTGLGMSKSTTELALALPQQVGLAFSPYAHDIRKWAETAHGKGYEIYTEVPMEPLNYPLADPGPNALLTDLKPAELQKRIAWIMKRTPLDVGLISPLEEKFSSYEESMVVLMQAIKQSDQFFILGKTQDTPSALPQAVTQTHALAFPTDASLDATISADYIQETLKKLETIAANDGHALAVGRPYPITLKHIKKWAKTLESKGLLLAPPSHIALQFYRQQQAQPAIARTAPRAHTASAHSPAQDTHATDH